MNEEYGDFYSLCSRVREVFSSDWENRESSGATLNMQKRAIIGYEKEKNYFLDRIRAIIGAEKAEDASFPPWYDSLAAGIYHENWGMAGIAEWFRPEWSASSSAKIIGEDIYFLEEGRMVKKPQRIGRERLQQLIRAFLLLTPEERMDKDYHESYLLDGTRVTVFTEPMAKKGRPSVIFRRYVIPSLSFEEQARRGTIPFEAILLFKTMVRIGFNVAFLGAVRTAKTTFLSTWQSYEDPSLEGVMVETDPEIPLHRLLPGAPILQLIADGDRLLKISKNLLRSDADYFILAEARDGIALDTAVRVAAKGTKRMKITFHSRLPRSFPLEAATEIVKSTGGDMELTMKQVASSFDYLFHFIQLADKRKKRLKGIYQMSVSRNGNINIKDICSYDPLADLWRFRNVIGASQAEYAREADPEALEIMRAELAELSKSPVFSRDSVYSQEILTGESVTI